MAGYWIGLVGLLLASFPVRISARRHRRCRPRRDGLVNPMSAVPLRNNKAAAASAARSVTVLGATGSIGDSTMDLLRGARDRYRVEALTANSNVEGLAKLAKEFGARFAAIAEPTRLSAPKDAIA